MTMTVATSPISAPKVIPPARWLLTVVGLISAVVAINFYIAYRMDVFGVLRDATGRSLVTAAHERKAKFLLNESYVPQNFDALIVGGSPSMNWRCSKLTGYRFYNESLEGGNASEERALVELALKSGHFKVAVIDLHPHIVAVHALQDGLDTVDKAEALGSEVAYRMEFHALKNHFIGQRPPVFFPDGSHDMPVHDPGPPERGVAMDKTVEDPVAMSDERTVIQDLISRGVRIVYVVSPLYGANYATNRAAMDAFLSSVKTKLPEEPIIDFNAPQYDSFRYDPENFIDEVHLSAKGADKLSEMLNTRMQEALAGR